MAGQRNTAMMMIMTMFALLFSAYGALAAKDFSHCSSRMDVVMINMNGLNMTTVSTFGSTYYTSNLKRCWIIVSSADQYIDLDFLRISTEPVHDKVQVRSISWYDVSDKSVEDASAPLVEFSGEHTREWFLQQPMHAVQGQVGQALMVTLSTDASMSDFYGVEFKISAAWRDCYTGMQVLRPSMDGTALQFSDGYDVYPFGVALCFVIVPPSPQTQTEIRFSSMNIEENYDILDIARISLYDEQQRRYEGRSTVYAKISGSIVPFYPITTGYGELTLIRFRSDLSLSFAGFSGSVSARLAPTARPTPAPTRAECDTGIVNYNVGYEDTVQLNYNEPWMDARTCYTFTPEDNARVSIQFPEFDLGENDYIRVVAIGRDINVVTALLTGQFRGIKRIARETFEPSKVYVANNNEVVVAYVVTEGTVPTLTFRTEVAAMLPLTSKPTKEPTPKPTKRPTPAPTKKPTKLPTLKPSKKPTAEPTLKPSKAATLKPTKKPTREPTTKPSKAPTQAPTKKPTKAPTAKPTKKPVVSSG